MQAQSKKQSAAIKRRMSRHGSIVVPDKPKEVPWDLVDRLLVPIICCHAAAILISGVLNLLRISQVSAFVLFILFTILTVSAALIYHNLKVSAVGKGVLLTGCESPLARCLAKKLDELGFTVFASFRKLKGNSDAVTLNENSSGRLHTIQLDVTSEVQMLEASLYVTEHLPDGANGLWALVNCEMWSALGEMEWIPFPVMRKSFDINVLGTARLTQILLPLIRRTNGRVIFLSSALSRIPSAVRGVQCSTQAAVEGIASCLRHELKTRSVDVSIVCAGEFTAGNAWLDDKVMLEQAKIMWSTLSEEQKETYGEEYFEKAIRSLEKYMQKDADFTPAVKSLTDAIIRSFPLPRYTPLTKYEKLQTVIAEHMPTSFYELVYKV